MLRSFFVSILIALASLSSASALLKSGVVVDGGATLACRITNTSKKWMYINNVRYSWGCTNYWYNFTVPYSWVDYCHDDECDVRPRGSVVLDGPFKDYSCNYFGVYIKCIADVNYY